MLLIEALVQPSSIHGLGVFALHPIPAGTPIARWTKGVDYWLSLRDRASIPKELLAFLDESMWYDAEENRWYGTVGDSRFINHAKPANLTWEPKTKTSYANREILMHEELTEDYSEYDANFSKYAHEFR